MLMSVNGPPDTGHVNDTEHVRLLGTVQLGDCKISLLMPVMTVFH